MSKRRERERRKQKKISLLFKQKKTTKKTSETHGVGGVLAELLEGVGLGLLGLLVGLGGGDLLDLEERVGERERFLLLLVVEVEREKKNRVREVFLFPRAFFAFLSLPCFFFNESISSRCRPFRPRSARPRGRMRSKRPRGGGGTPPKAFDNASPSSIRSKQTNGRKRCRG